MSKYHAVKVRLDGHCFDSKAEAAKYSELLLLQGAGLIRNLEVHPVYELIPAFTHSGKRILATRYEADFCYYDEALGVTVVLDVKGVETAVFKLKRKLLLWRYPNIYFVVEKVT
jgi:hypothetical protein